MGGAERQATYLAQFLKNTKEFDVIVWSFFDGDTIKEILNNHGIRYLIMPPKTGVNKLLRLWNLFYIILKLRKLKPYVLMPFTDYPNKISGLIWKFTGAKSCIWNQRDEGREITGNYIEKVAVKKTPCFIANSLSGKKFLIEQFGVLPHKIKIINNGIKIIEYRKDFNDWRNRLKIDKNMFVVVMVANIHYFKDHYTLLKAWSFFLNNLITKKPFPLLLFAGRFGSSKIFLDKKIKEMNLGNSIRFLGEVREITGLIETSDLCVFSSKNEGCPNAVLEYMVMKKAVIATDIIGIREALGDNYPFLVPANDFKTFANYIYEFYEKPQLLYKYGLKNFNRVKNKFSLEKMNNEYYKFLEQI